ncbi:probable G-protein coupled receptor No9 [Pollicipes pollicipes]|uniref:probable G-protein coupled receptor No9 n=1 Tax=Pollicipes pollicipes TaxID=41117 RepID=UPI0018858C86|nr:probable G-protein coupled receptor No9 [Pollicipes pollicipes]
MRGCGRGVRRRRQAGAMAKPTSALPLPLPTDNATLNASCAEAGGPHDWADQRLLSLLALAFLNVMVVAGNVLVVMAVFVHSKLRTVTNLFIVSLACADLLVGILVLPFSATLEVLDVWLYGDIWCSVWLAVDVWMCTASILNLCAISLDRYLAITKPISYPSLMSTRRAKLLIAAVWVLSFVICFPPLVGWNDRTGSLIGSRGSGACRIACELTNERGYVIYSALGSFFIPSAVMLFFYGRIYHTAVSTTRAINQGFRTTKEDDEGRLTLRIHRGRSVTQRAERPAGDSAYGALPGCGRPHGQVRLTLSEPGGRGQKKPSFVVHCREDSRAKNQYEIYTVVEGEARPGRRAAPPRRPPAKKLSSCSQSSEEEARPRFISRVSRRNIRHQARRFRMETKAAKTVGIIIGLFILCWLPFFVCYLVRGFCRDCVHPLLFSVFFWLGYCNSAINPCVYALCSRDFRFAFSNIVCRCVCRRGAMERRFRRSLVVSGRAASQEEEADTGRGEGTV